MRDLKKLSAQKRAKLTTALSTLMGSGVPLLKALDIIQTTSHDLFLKRQLIAIKGELKKGKSLSLSFQKQGADFDAFYVALIRLGEETGQLDAAFEKLSIYEAQKIAFKNQLVQALTYPALVLTTALFVLLIMVFLVMPAFEKIFQDFHHTLPPLTRFVMAFAKGLAAHFFSFSCSVFLGIALVKRLYAKKPLFRCHIHHLLLKLPLIREGIENLQLARLLFYLSTLQKAGHPLLKSITLLIEITAFLPYVNALKQVQKKLCQGKPLWQSLRETLIFPTFMIEMIKIGEASGALDEMLEKSARHYEEALSLLLKQLHILLEPLLLIILGLVMGTLIVAMYWPIFTLGAVF